MAVHNSIRPDFFLKYLLLFLLITGLLFTSCKDNPSNPDPPEEQVEITIVQPQSSAGYWDDRSVPCQANIQNAGSSTASWQVDSQPVDCVNGELDYPFDSGEHDVAVHVDVDGNTFRDEVTITVNKGFRVTVNEPVDGATFSTDEDIPCEANVEPSEYEKDLVWQADDETVMCTDNILSDLPQGEYTIAAEVAVNNRTETDAVEILIQDAPEIHLQVGLPRPDLEPSNSIDIANGEAVALTWETKNSPESCEAQGNWNGQKSNQGSETTEDLYGPQSLTFSLYCKNAVGEDRQTVEVNVASPGETFAKSDRPDEKSKEQVKVVYVLPKDQESRDLDLLDRNQGGILDDVEKFQEWFKSQTSGSYFRMDTYDNGDLDITRIRLNETVDELNNLDYQKLHSIIRNRLDNLNFNLNHKQYLGYYDGPKPNARGSGGLNYAFIYLNENPHENPPADLATKALAVHELIHAMGMVDEKAPNYDKSSHIDDKCPRIIKHGTISDLMCGSGGSNEYEDVGDVKSIVTLDYNRDDYYNDSNDEGDLPDNVTNMADSPWIIHSENKAKFVLDKKN